MRKLCLMPIETQYYYNINLMDKALKAHFPSSVLYTETFTVLCLQHQSIFPNHRTIEISTS